MLLFLFDQVCCCTSDKKKKKKINQMYVILVLFLMFCYFSVFGIIWCTFSRAILLARRLSVCQIARIITGVCQHDSWIPDFLCCSKLWAIHLHVMERRLRRNSDCHWSTNEWTDLMYSSPLAMNNCVYSNADLLYFPLSHYLIGSELYGWIWFNHIQMLF